MGAGGDASKMMRSDVLDSYIVWPPASSSSKLMLIENSGGELGVVTSVPGGSVWGRISDVDRDGVMSRVNITTLMMISALTNVWQKITDWLSSGLSQKYLWQNIMCRCQVRIWIQESFYMHPLLSDISYLR